MKLLYRTTRTFLLATVLILLITGTGLYQILRVEISNEMNEQLTLQAVMVGDLLQNGKTAEYPFTEISKTTDKTGTPDRFGDTLIYDRIQHIKEHYRFLDIVRNIRGENYHIKVMTSHVSWNEFYKTMLISLLATIMLLAISGILINYYSNKNIWAPFFLNLEAVRSHSVRSGNELVLKNSSINEFKELENTLKDLADRSRKEYMALREFTENASHELQTPLGIVQSKLDRISQLNVSEEMALYIVQAKSGIERLNKMNKSLLLLAKLDNDAFDDKQVVRFDQVLQQHIELMEDLFSSKKLRIVSDILETTVFANQYLCEVLVSNLFSNALRYTPQGGTLSIQLEPGRCCIYNTGDPLDFSPEFLFDRFRKSSRHFQSNGLGLAIVRQICLLNKWDISYTYGNGQHGFIISFEAQEKA